MEITMHRPSRKMRVGELFDVQTGRFIRSISESTGTTRKVATDVGTCMNCSHPIGIGDEYEEDYVIVCSSCCDKFDGRLPEAPSVGREIWQVAKAAVRLYWAPVTALWSRIRPSPRPWRGLKVTPNLTRDELLKIQPDIASYCAELQREGHPWTALGGLLLELNRGAMQSVELAEALDDVRWRLNEGLALLREPIDFNSKFDHDRIRQAKDHFTQAHRRIMFTRHRTAESPKRAD